MTLTPLWGLATPSFTYYPAIMFVAVACGWRYGTGCDARVGGIVRMVFLDVSGSPLHEQQVAVAVFIAANLIPCILLSEAITRARLRACKQKPRRCGKRSNSCGWKSRLAPRQSAAGSCQPAADAVRDGSRPGTHCTMRHRFPIPLRQPAICGTVGTHPEQLIGSIRARC